MNSKHPVALFSSAVLGNYFLVILLVTLFVSAVPAAYAMTSYVFFQNYLFIIYLSDFSIFF